MARMWYYSNKNQQKGPISWEELCGLASEGRLRNSDMVWQEGTPDWVRADAVRGLVGGQGRGSTDIRDDEPASRRRPARDDYDVERRPRGRSSRQPQGSSKGLIIGLVAGGGTLLVAAVVVVILIVANSGSTTKKKEVVFVPPGGGPIPVVKVAPPPFGGGGGGVALPGGRPVLATKAGNRIVDSLTNFDSRDPADPACFCKVFQVQMMAGRTYTIDYIHDGFKGGGHFDPFLRLVDARGLEVSADDDGGSGLNSRITYGPPRTESYRIVCTTLGPNTTGAFTLIVREN